MLKILWDYVHLVRSSIDDWKTTPWESINVEQMDMDCKKFAKVAQVLQLNFRKNWFYVFSVFCLKLLTIHNSEKTTSIAWNIFQLEYCFMLLKILEKNP